MDAAIARWPGGEKGAGMSWTRSHVPCLKAWPRLAAQAGRDPAMAPHWLRADGSVLRFGDVVLKHAPAAFGRTVRAHRQAARLLRGDPQNRAVPFLGFDVTTKVLMVGVAPGESLAFSARSGTDPAQLSGLVGRWLRAFHDARERRVAAFDAVGPLRRVPRSAAFLPEAYRAVRRDLQDQAQVLHGKPHDLAVLHGDLNATNLLISGPVVTGLDFDNLRLHPALRDAGQVLAALHLRAAEAPSRVLPSAWRAAFQSNYGHCGPLLDFFVLQRMLLHWAQVPDDPCDLGPSRRHMARRLEALFAA